MKKLLIHINEKERLKKYISIKKLNLTWNMSSKVYHFYSLLFSPHEMAQLNNM